ncbi:hypothetical protein FKM82_016216 [Ascaphus truei]
MNFSLLCIAEPIGSERVTCWKHCAAQTFYMKDLDFSAGSFSTLQREVRHKMGREQLQGQRDYEANGLQTHYQIPYGTNFHQRILPHV